MEGLIENLIEYIECKKNRDEMRLCYLASIIYDDSYCDNYCDKFDYLSIVDGCIGCPVNNELLLYKLAEELEV